MSGLGVCEGVRGMWNYHLSENNGATSLCGAWTMPCCLDLKSWGHKSEHLPETYCAECEQIASAMGEGVTK